MDNDSILNEPAASAEEFPGSQATEGSNEKLVSELEQLKVELDEIKEKYVRIVAEFDNFRKRTSRERIELIQTASKDVLVSMLEVLDDAERAQEQLQSSSNVDQLKQGVQLVFNKLKNILQAKGVKKMQAKGTEFNPDLHEAVAEVPAGKDMTGKVVDVVQDGYYLNDKIIRFAKVVVGK